MDIVRAVEYRHFLNRRSHVACGYKDKSNINIVESVTMEGILDSRNLMEAFKKVVRKQGASGVYGMQTTELESYIKHNPRVLTEALRQGKYKPKPIRRVYIPKDNGELRSLIFQQ